MPTRFNTNYFRLKEDDEFEELIRDICELEWNDPRAKRNGRNGQEQKGVDVYGQPIWLRGEYYGVQCKLRPSQKQLAKKEIEQEIGEARDFEFPLVKLIIATDTPRDHRTQVLVDQISDHEIKNGGFQVEIWFWPDIERRIATYPRILIKYYHDHLTSLTNTALLQQLVDRPLQVLSLNFPSPTEITSLEEHLKFRGINIVQEVLSPLDSKTITASDLLPDGFVCQVNTAVDPKETASLFKILTHVLSWEKLVETRCPIFIICPASLLNWFREQLHLLHGNPDRFVFLTDKTSTVEAANLIFSAIFNYGYERRGTLPTINITARTMPNKTTSALLDMDWQSHLDTKRHPSPSIWDEFFVTALESVTSQLINLKEATRIQVDSTLPVPASIALGYYLNLRVALLGTWGREMGKRDVKHLWLSDSAPAKITPVETWFKESKENAYSAILELTEGYSIHAFVERFVEQNEITADVWLQVHLQTALSVSSNIEEAHATAYASYVGSLLRRLTERGITDFHLFLRIPTALGILIGQKLHACGRIHLYWFDNTNSTYWFAFTLK